VIGVARVWVASGRALGLRRLGRVAGPREHAGRPGDVLELELRSPETVARWVGGHGPDVVVLDPPELVDAVRRGWLAAAKAHATTTSSSGTSSGPGGVPTQAGARVGGAVR
jgi:proteasome accessory factor B